MDFYPVTPVDIHSDFMGYSMGFYPEIHYILPPPSTHFFRPSETTTELPSATTSLMGPARPSTASSTSPPQVATREGSR